MTAQRREHGRWHIIHIYVKHRNSFIIEVKEKNGSVSYIEDG